MNLRKQFPFKKSSNSTQWTKFLIQFNDHVGLKDFDSYWKISSKFFNPFLFFCIAGLDPASSIISRFVRVSSPSEWTPRQPCPLCRQPLKPAIVVVALPCNHVLHLDCLNYSLTELQESGSQLHIHCAVCGCVYGEKHGNQPPGTMEWGIIDKKLPGHPNCNTIQIVYKWVPEVFW